MSTIHLLCCPRRTATQRACNCKRRSTVSLGKAHLESGHHGTKLATSVASIDAVDGWISLLEDVPHEGTT